MSNSVEINLETKRLILRNFVEEDVSQDYVDWLNDPEINQYLNSGDRTQDLERCIQYVCSYDDQDNRALVGIFLKEDGLHLGNVTLASIDWKNKKAIIGICLGRKDYLQKGLAKEALLALIEYSFEELKLHRMEAYVNTNNVRSYEFFKSCGLENEGIMRESNVVKGKLEDAYIVAILNRNK